jgi:SAM-dependent methyltransferase
MGIASVIAAKFESASERVEHERAEFNFSSIQPQIPHGSKVLDVGAWRCYLGRLLRDRMNCDVLGLDVVNANKTELPMQIFDGKALPVAAKSYDVILLLYVLHHASDDQPLLMEAHRALRDNGCVLVAEDNVDSLWNRIQTVGFHIYLWLVTGMPCDGTFRPTSQWQRRFHDMGFRVKATVHLGHSLHRLLWPKNTLFVLEKANP